MGGRNFHYKKRRQQPLQGGAEAFPYRLERRTVVVDGKPQVVMAKVYADLSDGRGSLRAESYSSTTNFGGFINHGRRSSATFR